MPPLNKMDALTCDQNNRKQSFKWGRQNSDGDADCPDIDFDYSDTDLFHNELAEIYSYSEQPEFQLNLKAFEELAKSYKPNSTWNQLSEEQRESLVMKLLDLLECNDDEIRMNAARCVLYIVQGCWVEVQSDKEQQTIARDNVFLLYKLGVFSAFVDLLNIEIEAQPPCNTAAFCLSGSKNLRIVLSVLCTFAEVIREESERAFSKYVSEVEAFRSEIISQQDELLPVKLLNMITKFCTGRVTHYPMKKILLLLWKLILLSLGGMDELKELKLLRRHEAGLGGPDEDTVDVGRKMRPSTPPTNPADLLDTQNQKRNGRPFRKGLMKQNSLNDDETLRMELCGIPEESDMDNFDDRQPMETRSDMNLEAGYNVDSFLKNYNNTAGKFNLCIYIFFNSPFWGGTTHSKAQFSSAKILFH